MDPMTRPQVIASLREEFRNARNVLIANKTVTGDGTWKDLTGALEQTDQAVHGTSGGGNVEAAQATPVLP